MDRYNQSDDWHRQAKEKWDNMADFWHQNSRDMWDAGSRKTIIPLFKRFAVADRSNSVLDAGCGDGYGSYKLYQAGYKVIGVDLSEEMIKTAKFRGENEFLQFQQADLTKLPFGDQSFSAILSINAVEWVEHPLNALNELQRVLKKGGLLCLGILGPTAAPRENSYRRLYGEEVVCNTMMPWECARLCEENGWTVVYGEGVYKEGVTEDMVTRLSQELRQSLTFMWLFILKRVQ